LYFPYKEYHFTWFWSDALRDEGSTTWYWEETGAEITEFYWDPINPHRTRIWSGLALILISSYLGGLDDDECDIFLL